MATNARGQTILDGTPVTRASIQGLLLQVNDIRPVANTTERAQLVVDLNAAGIGPTAARPLYVDRADAATGQHLERTHNGTAWEAVPSSSSIAIPMIGVWSASSLVATNVGSLLMVTGTIATTSNTVPGGVSTNVGVVPVGWRPSGEAHATLSGQILGAALPYTARGSLVVTPSGNVSVFTESLTTTLQVSLVCVR